MYLVLVFTAAALLMNSCCFANNVNKHMRLLTDTDNFIESNGVPRKSTANKKFLTIRQRPETSYLYQEGDTLQLVCDALGVPAPSVRWYKNDAPIYEYDMKSNELLENNPSSMGRVTSTLIVLETSGRDVYTCVVKAGSKTARANSIVYGLDGSTEVSEHSKLYPLTPRVVAWYKVYLNTIGKDIVLPCHTKGHPRPNVTWKDNMGNVVKDDSRMKVLRSGELMISDLRWTDMGEFTCVASNIFGTTAAKTFVYPAKAD